MNQAKDWNELLQSRGEEAVRDALLQARDFDTLKVYEPIPPAFFPDPEHDHFEDE